jgi:hypothetical protein
MREAYPPVSIFLKATHDIQSASKGKQSTRFVKDKVAFSNWRDEKGQSCGSYVAAMQIVNQSSRNPS